MSLIQKICNSQFLMNIGKIYKDIRNDLFSKAFLTFADKHQQYKTKQCMVCKCVINQIGKNTHKHHDWTVHPEYDNKNVSRGIIWELSVYTITLKSLKK